MRWIWDILGVLSLSVTVFGWMLIEVWKAEHRLWKRPPWPFVPCVIPFLDLLHCCTVEILFFASWLRIKPHADTSLCQTETMVTTRFWGKLQKGTLSLSFRPKDQKWVITVLSCGASKSYVYLPWVHHTQEQWMDVDEFIDQVPKPLKTRNLGKDDQVDFILSPLRGSTLEDICLCAKGEILSFLREAQYSTAVGYLS